MKADIETLQKRREFLSRTGIVVLGALPAGVGFTPRTALAEGCGVGMIAKGAAGSMITAAGGAAFATGVATTVAGGAGAVGIAGGTVVMAVGTKITVDSGVFKACVKPTLERIKEKFAELTSN